MCSPHNDWDQLSLFPATNSNGSKPNDDAQSSTSRPDVADAQRLTDKQAEFVLTCECSGVTLIKRFALPLSWLYLEKGGTIVGTFVAELITDAQEVGASTCAKP